MKKFLAKLALFSIISLIAASLNMSATFAEEEMVLEPVAEEGVEAATPEEIAEQTALAKKESEALQKLAKALEDLKDPKDLSCIKNKTKDDPDYGYIITTLEEPLTLKEKGSTEAGDEYVTRICYRNHFSYKGLDGKVETISVLATNCSQDIQKFEERFGSILQKEYNIKYGCDPVQVILSKGGTSLIEGYIGSLYRWGASIAGIIAVLVIIISGIQISVAGGEPQAIEDAKKRIMKSIGGIIILFLSGLILYTINPTFFVR